MRKKIVSIWSHIMRIKVFYPLVVLERKLMYSDMVNSAVDFLDRCTDKERLKHVSDFFENNKEKIQDNKNALSDEKSRLVYENIIRYRSTLNRKYLRAVRDPLKEQYFCPEIIKLGKKEFFINCGGYIGDTAISFEKKYPHWERGGGGITTNVTMLCFEPDKSNAMKCKRSVKNIEKRHSDFKGYVISKGVWEKDETLYFKGGEEYSNKLEKTNSGNLIEVPVTSIDSTMKKYREKTNDKSKVTFIQMDIEGSEPEGLIGAQNTILQDRPVLAISIYHSEEQMISIIEWCRINLKDYNFYVRHYSPAWGETDLYAIPYEYNKGEN